MKFNYFKIINYTERNKILYLFNFNVFNMKNYRNNKSNHINIVNH